MLGFIQVLKESSTIISGDRSDGEGWKRKLNKSRYALGKSMGKKPSIMIGGCKCGLVRYECNAEPVLIFNCHCKDCQHFSGAPCTTAVIVSEDQLIVKGELAGFTTVGENGGFVHRHFCPTCGTPVIVNPEAFLGMKAIKASSLDDSSWVRPQMDIFLRSKQPWIELANDTEKFNEGPS